MSVCKVCGDPRGGQSWHPCLHWFPGRGYARAPHTGLCAICLCSHANGPHWCLPPLTPGNYPHVAPPSAAEKLSDEAFARSPYGKALIRAQNPTGCTGCGISAYLCRVLIQRNCCDVCKHEE